jgi:taurine dioxygenase
MGIEIRPLSAAVGVEIAGVDLSQDLSAETWAVIDNAWREHHLLLFREQDFSAERQVAFSEHFGPVSRQGENMKHGRDFMHISNTVPGGAVPNGELLFHSDHVFFEKIMKAISLYAVEVPSHGGETVFANGELAYRSLPEDLKRRIAPLRARHAYGYTVNAGNRRMTLEELGEGAIVAEHPIAWPHPETGRPVLMVAEMMTQEIVGLDRAESDALLDGLLTYVKDPRVQYRHAWRLRDFIIWDNRSLQHARTDFDPKEKRTLRRVPIAEVAYAGNLA